MFAASFGDNSFYGQLNKGALGLVYLFSESTIQKANQHERQFIEKFYDKSQYRCNQKGGQLEDDKKSPGCYPSVFSGR